MTVALPELFVWGEDVVLEVGQALVEGAGAEVLAVEDEAVKDEVFEHALIGVCVVEQLAVEDGVGVARAKVGQLIL